VTSNKTLSFTALIVACAALWFAVFQPPQTNQTARESAYERVLRTRTLRFGYFLWTPFVTQDPNTGVLGGFEIEYCAAVANSLGLKVSWHEILQGQQVDALKSGKVDAICDDGPFLTSAALYLQYVEPMMYETFHLYARADDRRFDNALEKVNNPDVAMVAMDGDISLDIAIQMFPKVKLHQLPNSADPKQVMLDVAYRKADVVINDTFSAADFMRDNPGALREVPLDKPIAHMPNQFSVLRGEGDLADMLSQGVRNVRLRDIEDAIFARIAPEYQPGLRRLVSPYR
jgi:ABC-type amino acid transport substrate-binding protein